MSRCTFAAVAPGRFRCTRCGFETASPFGPERIHRLCDAVLAEDFGGGGGLGAWRLGGLEQETPAGTDKRQQASPPSPHAPTPPAPSRRLADRGLGDTVARFLNWIGIKKRPGCGCERRQEWLNRLFPYRRSPAEPPVRVPCKRKPRLLFRFPHGLGDCVQLTVVLQHLKHLRPDWEVHVAVRPGAEGLYRGLAAGVWPLSMRLGGLGAWRGGGLQEETPAGADKRQQTNPPSPHPPTPPSPSRPPRPSWDYFRFLQWPESSTCYADSPATKAEWCLRNVFHIEPRLEWCRYRIEISPEKRDQAARWIERVAEGRPGVLIHFRGASSRRKKNVPVFVVRRLVQELSAWGVVPVVLDWLPDSPARQWPEAVLAGPECELWQGRRWADAELLAALAERAQLCVGIDSGPGHVFGATGTPTLLLWTEHHPLHFYGLSPNVVHLVPVDHERLLREPNRQQGLAFFKQHYQYRIYQHLEEAVVETAWEVLSRESWVLGEPGETQPPGPGAHTKNQPHSRRPQDSRPKTQDQNSWVLGDQEKGANLAQATAPGTSPIPGAPRLKTQDPRLLFDGNCWVRRRWHEWDMVVVRDVLLEDCYQVDRLPFQPRFVVDVGAHIGCFVRRVSWRLHPQGVVVCVEANPKNLPVLKWNLKRLSRYRPGRYEALWAACTYDPGPLGLLDTVFEEGLTTGGSVVVRREEQRFAAPGKHYQAKEIEIPKVTLEEIQWRYGMPRIDLLKLDCEGSEYSILENCDLSTIRHIVGEYHDRRRFEKLRRGRLKDWDVKIIKDGQLGLFWASR